MLERLVAWVLNNYLGKYVENLNTDQLSIALLQGSVELENLPLKKDAFSHFGLPLHLKHGLIGKVKLKVPVTQLRSAPWIIVVEELTIVLTPLSLSEWDEEAEENAANEYKLSLLDSMEANWRSAVCSSGQDSSYYASSYYSWFSYGSGLVTNIIENIQLEIKNVHLRYEDNVTTEKPFTLGIKIDSLSVQSCNEEWSPGYTCWDAGGDKHSFQLLQLDGFSVYFDDYPECDLNNLENFTESGAEKETHDYILQPICAEAHIKRNRSAVPLRSRTQPRIICDLQLQNFLISITDAQYVQLVHCSKGLKRIQRCRKYIRFRPSCSVHENPRTWWLYMLKCYRYKMRGTINKVISWDQCLLRAKENVSYVKMYMDLLSNITCPTNLPADLKELKSKVEWERGYDELRSLREVAMFRIKSPSAVSVNEKLSNTGGTTLFQWFPQWWGWYSTTENLEDSKSANNEDKSKIDPQLGKIEDEILDAIADTVENNTILRRDTVFGQFNFTLNEGNIRLNSIEAGERKCVMELLFNNVRLELESRPRSSSSRVHVSLGSVILNDYLTENSLFPVLISPQNSDDAPSGRVNRNVPATIAKLLTHTSVNTLNSKSTEPLFQLTYEYKPFTSTSDYKLHIKSQSLDIVYNADALKWLLDFFVKPHQKSEMEIKRAAKMRYYSMKQKTKEEFLKNWDHILQGHPANKKQWDVKLDISAPQIFLVEHFSDRNTIICIIDFGKLYFTNCQDLVTFQTSVHAPCTQNSTELDITEDDEAFATPCSTPPGSEVSENSESRRISFDEATRNVTNSINESNFHGKIYESYRIEFNELQVLLGRMKDNWKFAHLKGTSSLHVLDRFNISLQVERRVIHTTDPQYPALMVSGNLPKLIVHANEHKVQAMRSIYDTVVGYWAQTPFRASDTFPDDFGDEVDAKHEEETPPTYDIPLLNDNPDSKLFLIQFIIDQLALEVQSRGRSIAELQVSGVKATLTKRPVDTSLTLSVHSLLLVDALQTFGPDFELLLASHKHVGMDSMSGSLKDSDPTSPVSPGSPDPCAVKNKVTTPITLQQALSSLNSKDETAESTPIKMISASPMGDAVSGVTTLPTFSDTEALILVDIVFVKSKNASNEELSEDMQIASIQFNNLDVVANQETIVELISFTRRVMSLLNFNTKYPQFDTSKPSFADTIHASSPVDDEARRKSTFGEPHKLFSVSVPALTKTELTFDFHRLNILLLRSVTLDSGMAVARKIATATMTDAKIHATVGDDLFIEGSLGGLQVLDLTAEGHVHQRIFSVGQDPLKAERCVVSREKRPSALFEHLSADIYNIKSKNSSEKSFVPAADHVQALNFTLEKSLSNKFSEHDQDIAEIKVKFSSALYTHAPHFVAELSNYATEFKQYLKNLARSIGSAATEMALGLVHARAEALAQSLSASKGHSLHGSITDLQPPTPRKHWMYSPSIDVPTELNTSYNTMSPADYDAYPTKIKLDLIIDSPTIILPRFATSYEVLVAHLGRIYINNEDSDEVTGDRGSLWTVKDRYNFEIRDMNLYSLNIENKIQVFTFKGDSIPLIGDCPPSMKAEDIYDCKTDGKPILHDTVIQLFVERDLKMNGQDLNFVDSLKTEDKSESILISGKITTPLKFSLTRQQYEQLIETVNNVLYTMEKGSVSDSVRYQDDMSSTLLPNIAEESELRSNVSALDLDPALRAKMLQRHSSLNVRRSLTYDIPQVFYNVNFQVPVFTVELKADFGSGEKGLVELSFRDFVMQYDKCNQFETAIQMSLQSLVMEDLQREPNSKYRYMMMSSTDSSVCQPSVDFISSSCPDLLAFQSCDAISNVGKLPSSLPDYLETETVFAGFMKKPSLFCGDKKENMSYQSRSKQGERYPSTPPPSPRERRHSTMFNEDNLVHISVILYSKDSEQFFCNKVYRKVNVNFNSLDMIVNFQSWVVMLDFFGLGDDQLTPANPVSYSKPASRRDSSVSFMTAFESEMYCQQRSELDITIRSLSLILNRTDYEVAKANVSKLNAHITRDTNSSAVGDVTVMEGKIETMSIHDLTPTHGKLYNERFITSELDFYMKRYSKPDRLLTRDYDIDLKINMPSVTYTHTQRFTFDLQSYYRHFTRLQKIFNNIRSAAKVNDDWDLPTRVHLNISAASPVIIIPVSSQHRDVLIVDLGNLSIINTFKWSDSSDQDETHICLLDVMEVNLVNMDLFLGEWFSSTKLEDEKTIFLKKESLDLGSYFISKHGYSLLQKKCELKLIVERNISSHIHKTVPDMSFNGTLSTLAITVDLQQYKLLRGLLMYNIGECLDDLFAQVDDEFSLIEEFPTDIVWRTNCLHLDLVNVSVTLLSCDSSFSDDSLACVNFIKSHLSVESFSDKSQDVDLVSQEILITDTRFLKEPVNKRSNIFTNILQPLGAANARDNIRVEIHHRRRVDRSKFTILLNNMRLMAILDWWEMVRDFIICDVQLDIPEVNSIGNIGKKSMPSMEEANPIEIKFNVTNSEVVILEDTTQWDSNAVIFKSTTVVNYKPQQKDKILSCSLNHCEMFSCILGMEDETALSIIDPVTINGELSTRPDETGDLIKTLQICSHQLCLRLSYHDVRMFTQILKSLPKQTAWAKNRDSVEEDSIELPANVKNQVNKLHALGFSVEDCLKALEKCGGNLDNSALWLTQNAMPQTPHSNFLDFTSAHESYLDNSPFSAGGSNDITMFFQQLELKTDCLNICIIDDCQDSDVPLLELSMANLFFKKDFETRCGQARCSFSVDYYNRILSGWEPFLEPWSCHLNWNHSSSTELTPKRLVLNVSAHDVLNVNITSTLIDLYKNVKEAWVQDLYNPKERIETESNRQSGISGYRRRSPFVPFALKNETGCLLSISTSVAAGNCSLVSSPESTHGTRMEEDSVWHTVTSGETIQFSFGERDKHRHRDTHMVKHHQITVKVHGWKPVKPVSVDKVGVYFRHASPDDCSLDSCDLPQARIVFDVTMEGSARKLITVRSALLLYNQLQLPVEIKLENTPAAHSRDPLTYNFIVSSGKCVPVPLIYTHAQISLRPLIPEKSPQVFYAFSDPIFWQRAQRPGDLIEETRQCHSNKGSSYRFCGVIRRENYPHDYFIPPASSSNSWNQSNQMISSVWTHPGHVITFISPMIIVNLLPYDLHYIANDVESGRIAPGQQISLHEVSHEIVTEIIFYLESYPGVGKILIQTPPVTSTSMLKLQDHSGRKLHLNVSVSVHRGSEIKVTVYAPYWIVNKTALPLVFRQEGVPTETAGQYEEHEIARMVAPLMFSLTDAEASPTVVARVGSGVHTDGIPHWCQHFHIHVGVQVRRLRVSLRDHRPDAVYMIGINVRPGRGRYRDTFIITLSAHYQIHNKSTYTLQFAQKCFASTVSDPGAKATYLQAMPNCNLPFHWPRLDKDQLLCLRMLDIPGCLWSGGFKVTNDAFHINIRDQEGRMHFLRVEIVLQDATYFIIFLDAETMPPPLRIDNFSQVNLHFHQLMSDKHCVVRAHSSIPYAWDEPVLPHTLTLIAPGGVSANYNVNQLGKAADLTYENFIYIAFTATFNNVTGNENDGNTLDVQQQQLVLDVLPNSDRVVLNQKEIGARSQFWRMTGTGQLQHEGSSPPVDPRTKRTSEADNVMVLDIAGPALQPKEFVGLALRKPSQRRLSTQTWRFTEDGRLCCAHNNMCVQAKDGFFGLRKGNYAVLGPTQKESLNVTPNGVPFEEAITRQKLRPGSGFLSVNISTDGPTRVVEITDIQDKKTCALVKDCDWVYVDKIERPAIITKDAMKPYDSKELELNIDLNYGIGLSLISKKPAEELVFCRMAGIMLQYVRTFHKECVDLCIRDVQIDNQLFEAQCDVLLYVMPNNRNTEPEEASRPALQMFYERTLNNFNVSSRAEIIKSLIVRVKNSCLILEERLLLKLVLFFGYKPTDQELENIEENDFETQQILADVASVHSKRYYFEILELVLGQLRLSVLTNNKLAPQLRAIKRKFGLTLLKFEDATLDLKPFMRFHFFETSRYVIHTIAKHFRDELKWQSGKILGSVDFLGNPVGFVNDLSEGVSGLIYEGNVGALVQNITHGLSNSAAKVTETLSDGLGLITMDEQHEETRRRIRGVRSGTSGDHLAAGFKGLAFGLLGGVTSLVRQTYEGASNEGVQGFVTGLGKGLVGTVTKPVVGMLDLASETASAVRDSSRSSSKIIPNRLHKPRCVMGPTGLLPLYSAKQSLGQELLYMINHHNYSEVFIAYDVLRTSGENFQIIVSNEKVRVFTRTNTLVLEAHLRDLFVCQPLIQDTGREVTVYIELHLRGESHTYNKPAKRPRVRCDNESVAAWISEQVNYAINMYIERQHTLVPLADNSSDE
ncbi:intermembrane lipid transfer protein Vps13D isoform X2 [Planococcus citri]|uniref:intermembrane lipid transfer protein Vps13D isoform X2 n=1 Tax=Planococcus citri TaxID=170843 RepID=UPI0031F7EB52